MGLFKGFTLFFQRFIFPPSRTVGIEFDCWRTSVMSGTKLLFQQPTCIAYVREGGSVLAIGKQASNLIGKTPAWVQTQYLLENDCVTDTKLWEQFINVLLQKLPQRQVIWQKYSVVVTVPVNMPSVHRLLIQDSLRFRLGSIRICSRVEAAYKSLNSQKQISQTACLLIIGDQSSEFGFFSHGQLVKVMGLSVGWRAFVETTIRTMREKYHLLVSQSMAQRLTKELGSVHSIKQSAKVEEKKSTIRAKNILTHLPETIVVSAQELMPGWDILVDQLIAEITHGLNEINPDILSEAFEVGINISSPNCCVEGLTQRLSSAFDAEVRFSDTALLDVVKGAQLLAAENV